MIKKLFISLFLTIIISTSAIALKHGIVLSNNLLFGNNPTDFLTTSNTNIILLAQ